MRFFKVGDAFNFFLDPPASGHLVQEANAREVDELIDAIMSCPAHFASTFVATLTSKLVITETLDSTGDPLVATADKTLQFSLGYANTVSSVTKIASMQKAMSAGAGTIDLTALTSRGVAVDFSALKVKAFALYNNSTHAITIVEGASNGNALLGTAFSLTLQAGDYITGLLTGSQTVGGTDKTIDLSGTGTDTLQLLLAAG